MDKKDLLILRCLDEDVRASAQQIGHKIRLKKETVNYRMSKLLEEKTIIGFYAIINGSRLGYSYHKILISYRNVSSQVEKEIINFLNFDKKNVVWFGISDDQYNLTITTMTKNLKEFKGFYENFIQKYGSYFQEKTVLQITMGISFNEKYLYDEGYKYFIENNLTESSIDYDETDLGIIRLISENSRTTYVQISQKLGLTSEGIRKRIKKLESNGIINGYKLRTNFSKFNLSYNHFFISLIDVNKKKEIINYYKMHKSCLAILEYIGRYDIHLEFVFSSIDELRNTISDLRDKFGDSISEFSNINIHRENSINIFPIKA
jgi:Lrp/AsnC family transcriptional regulator, leucine-responsive regulatory protein